MLTPGQRGNQGTFTLLRHSVQPTAVLFVQMLVKSIRVRTVSFARRSLCFYAHASAYYCKWWTLRAESSAADVNDDNDDDVELLDLSENNEGGGSYELTPFVRNLRILQVHLDI